jgi:hypothetical protein
MHTWTSADGKNRIQIDHVMINWRWYSKILKVRYFRGADSDMDYYQMTEKDCRVNKQPMFSIWRDLMSGSAHHVTRHNTPIHNILSTAPQFIIS